MTTYAILGGTGTIGRHIAALLRTVPDAEVRVLSRHSPTHPVDLTTGDGLGAALAGADVVIDAANGTPRRPEPVLVHGTRRLVETSARAGVRHLVCVSIVGIERVPVGYYRAKVAQEQIVRAGAVPSTIVRSTQFHELLDGAFTALARGGVSPRLRIPVQPVSAREAAAAVVEVARGDARAATVTVGGPQVDDVSAFARAWCAMRGRRLVPVPIPSLWPGGRALRAGALTDAGAASRGETSFMAWLEATDDR